MAWTQKTLSNAADCLTKFKAFVAGSIGAVTGTRTGSGRIVQLDVRPGVVSETWTLTCTVGGATGTFSVVGSVSGPQADATVGTAYSNTYIRFLLLDGLTDFVMGDTFIFTATAGGLGSQAWEVIADTASGIASEYDWEYFRVSSFTNTGAASNGTVNAFRVLDGHSGLETWTLTCTVAAANAGTFSVSGSLSGEVGTATVGVPFNNGRISFTLVDGSQDFTVGDYFKVSFAGSIGAVTGTRTGSGSIEQLYVLPGTVSETWTLTCTVGGATGTFSVVGSVSEAQADATVGTAYSNTYISFLLLDGLTDFVIGDTFIFTVTAIGPRRIQVFRSRGLAGADDNLYHTLVYEYYASSDRWFIASRGHSGYLSTLDTYSQPNMDAYSERIRLANTSMPAVFIADGRCAKMLVESSTTARQSNYIGFYLPHADNTVTPPENPFPYFNGASCRSTATGTPDSYAGADYTPFWNPRASTASETADVSARIAVPGGGWLSVYNVGTLASPSLGASRVLCFPWGSTLRGMFHSGCLGNLNRKCRIPSFLYSTHTTGVRGPLGELSGVQFISGEDVSAWDTLDSGTWLVWQAPNGSAADDFAVFELTGDEWV